MLVNGNELVMGVCYYPEHWDKSLWRDDLRRMKETGISVIRIAEFAWSKVEPREGEYDYTFFDEFLDLAYEMGIKVIFCTPTATPPAWLTHKYPEVLNVMRDGRQMKHGARRHYNYNSPVYQKFSEQITEKFAEHYAKHPAIVGWQLDNEFNCGVEEFYSESDQKAFRVFLRERYGTLDALNEAWGTVFWNQTYTDWEEVIIPWQADGGGVNPHQALDYYHFISHSARKFAKAQADIIRKYMKEGDEITTNGMFTNLDNHKMNEESLDFYCYDSYPSFAYMYGMYREDDKTKDRHWSRNLSEVRSISTIPGRENAGNFGIMEQQSGTGGANTLVGAPAAKPGQVTLWTMQSIAHGADMVSYFRWRTCTFGAEIYWHGILDYSGRDNRRFAEIKNIYKRMQKLNDVAGSKYVAEVAVMKDYDNVWDGKGDYWHDHMNRTSFEALFEGLQLSHTPYDYVYIHDDMTVEELTKYKVIFYPHAYILTEKRVEILKKYVEQGGKLVFGARAGLKNLSGVCTMEHLPGLAAELSGTDVFEFTICAPDEPPMTATWDGTVMDVPFFNDQLRAVGENAEELAQYNNSFYQGTGALVKNRYGKGETYYFGGCFSEENVKIFLEKLGVIAPWSSVVEIPKTCEIAVRRKSGEGRETSDYMFILNYVKEPAVVEFKKTVVNAETGEELAGKVELKPYEVLVVKV